MSYWKNLISLAFCKFRLELGHLFSHQQIFPQGTYWFIYHNALGLVEINSPFNRISFVVNFVELSVSCLYLYPGSY